MAIKTLFWDGQAYNANDFAAWTSTRTSGIYADMDFDMEPAGGMDLRIGAGKAWVRLADDKGKMIYSDAGDTITLPLPDGNLPCIVSVCLRYDELARESYFMPLRGTPASSPKPHAMTRTSTIYDLCICQVHCPAGAVEITWDDITDTRADEELCGYMRDAVTQIPTDALLSQALARVDNTMSAADQQIADKVAAYQIKLDALSAELAELKKQSGVMFTADFNPVGHAAGQLAFKDESMQLADFNPDGHAPGQVAFKSDEKKYKQGDIALWAPTPGGKDLSTAQKWAAEHGGTWQKIAEGRSLMGANASHAAGTTTEAGLPNITGTMIFRRTSQDVDIVDVTGGAFAEKSTGKVWSAALGHVAGANLETSSIKFDAAKSSAVYGKSTTVQPSAYWICIYLCLEGN